MPITLATNGNLRESVLAYLVGKKAENPNYRVLDIGGAAHPWADQFVDTYIDLQWFETTKEVFWGDICSEDLWDTIRKSGRLEKFGKWDFVICTHVLEDIRNPDFALRMIQEVADEGFIAMPNKHTELSVVENEHWAGYAHHRWIYSIVDGELRALAKTALANVFLKYRQELPWMDDSLVSGQGGAMELGFFWEKDIPFRLVGHDLVDANGPEELSRFYIEGLAEGL